MGFLMPHNDNPSQQAVNQAVNTPEPAQAQTPDYSTAEDAQDRRTQDQIRSGSNTILTTPTGVTSGAKTAAPALTGSTSGGTVLTGAAGDAAAPKKTLLGN
jgi:hypothetical protein